MILMDYIQWHYIRAFRSIWRVTNNFVYFFYHLFSIPLLVHTLFAPWKKMTEQKKKGLASPGQVFERVFGNLLVRIVGALVRLATLSVGLLFCAGVFICGVLFTVFWVLMPVVMILALIVGIRLII